MLFGALTTLLLVSEPDVVARHPLPGISLASGHPLALVVVLLTSGLLASAGAGLAHRADVEQDGALSLVAGAAVLMTAACLWFFALPSLSPQWMTSRDGLCLLAFVLIVAAGARQELAVRTWLVRAAAVAERLRVAGDLHDGLAQDLAVIAAHGARMADEFGVEHPVTVAARRAVSASRERAATLDGHLTVQQRRSGGTELQVMIP
jgi:signal transduction histidine kinase